MRVGPWLGVAISVLASCGGHRATTVDGVTAADGFDVDVVAVGLGGPTQFVVLDGGDLIVAELNGGEGDGTGRVLRVNAGAAADDPTGRRVLVDGLATPTGVMVDGDLLWIMEQRRLSVGPLDDPADRTVVLDELPFNGRSEGTLTSVAGGGILYNTSGSRDRDAPEVLVPGSGSIWYLAGPDAEPELFATGFTHAYARTFDADGRLWSTEMSDGTLDGSVPPDELVAVDRGDDFGYPRCVGDGVPVVELGSTAADCEAAPPSHALFGASATPTGLAVAPWDQEQLVVALWSRAEVVVVGRTAVGRLATTETLLAGIDHPQHLVVDGDRLLVGDFSGGRILAVTAP